MMLTNTMMYSFSGLGIFAILGMLNPENPQVVTAALCAVVPFVFSFVVAFVVYRDEAAPAENGVPTPVAEAPVPAPAGKVEIVSPSLVKFFP